MRHARLFTAFGIAMLLVAVMATAIASKSPSRSGDRGLLLKSAPSLTDDDGGLLPPGTGDQSHNRDCGDGYQAESRTGGALPCPPVANDDGEAVISTWHAPEDEDGTHDHGDPPPDWATDYSIDIFGHGIIFGGDEQTPNENALKHEAFKGFAGSADGFEMYARVHLQSNPMGRSAQFHSYELYVLDPAGNVSMLQGWLDFGLYPVDRGYRGPDGDPDGRPGIYGASLSYNGGEQWYSRPGGAASDSQYGSSTSEITGAFDTGWQPDFAFVIADPTTYFDEDEYDYIHNPDRWPATGEVGSYREGGFIWYRYRIADNMIGSVFYATQFGQIASGPDDPLCSSTTTVHGTELQNVCLRQELAATLFDAVEIIYVDGEHAIDCPKCVLPN